MRILRSVPDAADAPIALTIGNFDGVHRGHQAMLARLREAAESLSLPPCAMTFEPHPREFFAPDRAPARLTSLREKLERLAAHGIERTYVFRFDYRFAQIAADDFVSDTLVHSLGVRHVLIGDDFRFGARRSGDFSLLKQHGARAGFTVEAMSSVMLDGIRVSSTAVRDALTRGDLDQAARLLGRAYSISGRIVRGDAFGRRIGFPTANVRVPHNRPALSGIFAVEVTGVADETVRGIASLGVRPTVKEDAEPLLEVYLLDFSGDVYGRRVRVDFLRKFRDEQKFPDVAAMTEQISRDVEAARAYFGEIDSSAGTDHVRKPARQTVN